MAHYVEDFSAYSDASDFWDNWTSLWHTPGTTSIVTDASAPWGKKVEIVGPSQRVGIKLNATGDAVADFDILMMYEDSDSFVAGPCGRMAGNSSGEDGAIGRIQNDGTLEVFGYDNGSARYTSNGSQTAPSGRYFVRFQGEGARYYRFKAWLVGTKEPTDWGHKAESIYWSAGACGFYFYSGTLKLQYFAVGTEGDLAPMPDGYEGASFSALESTEVADGADVEAYAYPLATHGVVEYDWKRNGVPFSTDGPRVVIPEIVESTDVTCDLTVDGQTYGTEEVGTVAPATETTLINPLSGSYVDSGTSGVVDAATLTPTITIGSVHVASPARGNISAYGRIDKVGGKTPSVVIDWDTIYNGTPEAWAAVYDLLWTTTPDNPTSWTAFTSTIGNNTANTVTGSGTTFPAGTDSIYISIKPMTTMRYINAKIAEMISRDDVYPTDSGGSDYIYGYSPFVRDYIGTDQLLPPEPRYAFRFGAKDNPITCAVITGQHPSEDAGDHAHLALIDFLLSSDVTAASLREKFTFYFYPALSIASRQTGRPRYSYNSEGWDFEDTYDANRCWETEFVSCVESAKAAIVADLVAPDVLFDQHGFGDMIPRSGNSLIYTNNTAQTIPGTLVSEDFYDNYKVIPGCSLSKDTSTATDGAIAKNYWASRSQLSATHETWEVPDSGDILANATLSASNLASALLSTHGDGNFTASLSTASDLPVGPTPSIDSIDVILVDIHMLDMDNINLESQ